MNVIEIKDVSEKYRIKFIRDSRVSWEEVWALQDLNMQVAKGEVIGIIGPNGAGKTTLLKLISGMLIPDKGTIDVRGRVSVLMELGAGFNPEFTGRENIKFNARLYGLKEERLEEQMAQIISFAGLEDFIDAPIKSYSQGMFMRLAFALAIYVDPDILLIDDILAVGDQEAQEKCVKKVFEFKKAGKNIIVVSHDLNIIAKLCDKVILLEKGKIADSGLPEEVINRYLETVGDHAGIAALTQDKIRLVFNNGKIILSYAGLPVTAGMGGYALYLSAKHKYWIPSFNLNWKIANKAADCITAEGRDTEGVLAQIWNISLRENRAALHIEPKDNTAKDIHLDLGMNARYAKWLDRGAFNAFPGFAHKSNYQDLNPKTQGVMSIGLAADEDQALLPAAILTAGDKDNRIKLFNSGYDQEARIVHLGSLNNGALSLRVELLDKDEFGAYMEKEKALAREEEQLRLRQEQEEEKQRRIKEEEAQRQERQRRLSEAWEENQRNIMRKEEERKQRIEACTLISGNLCLFADLEARSLRINYKGKEVTGAYGLYTVFNSPGAVFNMNKADWRFERVSPDCLKLVMDFEFVSLFCEFNCVKADSLDVKIMMEVRKELKLIARSLIFELAGKYEGWSTPHESGDWFGQRYVNGIAPVRLQDSMVSAVTLKPGGVPGDNPAVHFESSCAESAVLGIYKRNEAGVETICLNYAPIILGRKHSFELGKYDYFSGRISLGKEKGAVNRLADNRLLRLANSSLEFIFDRGKSRIIHGSKELTCGLGLFTSVRYNGIWYDSYQAVWRQEQAGDKRIIVSGDWPYVPLSQIWEVELKGADRVSLRMKVKLHEKADIEIIQCNLMLSGAYAGWAVPEAGIKGGFPEEYTADYDILPFRFWYGKAWRLSANAAGVPDTAFVNTSGDDGFRAIVENTDYFYRGRLLQYQKTDIAAALSDQDFFTGEIVIGPNE